MCITGNSNIDPDDCIMLGDTLAAKIKLTLAELHSASSKLTIISGAEVGNKTFTEEILDGRLIDDNLSVKVSTNIHEEIVIEGRFTACISK